jgi:hypothetical protein
MMNKKEFNKYLTRDMGRCYHCGITDDTLVPQHRQGRGMGGSKARNVPSNIITFCSDHNGRIEANAIAKAKARRLGWSLESWQDPKTAPVFDSSSGSWYLLGDDFSRQTYPLEDS